MKRSLAWASLKYLVAFGLLAWVVWRSWDPPGGRGLRFAYDTHMSGVIPIQYGIFLAAVLLCLFGVGITFARWHTLLRATGVPARFTDVARLGAVGVFYNTFLPGAVGGDVVKAVLLSRSQSQRTTVVASILMDRAIGLWTVFGLAAVAGTAFWVTGRLDRVAPSLRWVVAAADLVAVTIALSWSGLWPTGVNWLGDRLCRLPLVGSVSANLWRAVLAYRRQPRAVCAAVLLAAVSHLAFVGEFALVGRTLSTGGGGSDVIPSFVDHTLIVPLGLLVRTVPISPGGIGIGELGFAELYQSFGAPAAAGVLASLGYRVIHWVVGLAGYLANVGGLFGSPPFAPIPSS